MQSPQSAPGGGETAGFYEFSPTMMDLIFCFLETATKADYNMDFCVREPLQAGTGQTLSPAHRQTAGR